MQNRTENTEEQQVQMSLLKSLQTRTKNAEEQQENIVYDICIKTITAAADKACYEINIEFTNIIDFKMLGFPCHDVLPSNSIKCSDTVTINCLENITKRLCNNEINAILHTPYFSKDTFPNLTISWKNKMSDLFGLDKIPLKTNCNFIGIIIYYGAIFGTLSYFFLLKGKSRQ